MANQPYINNSGTSSYRAATGSGTDVDPFIPTFNEPDIGTSADTAATTDSGTFSLIALFKRSLQQWSTFISTLGTTSDAASPTGSMMARLRQIADSSSSGGTQYADGATAATPTGTVAMANKSGVAKSLQVDSSDNLKVTDATLSSNFGATADASSLTGSLMSRIRSLVDAFGTQADASSSTGSLMARIRSLFLDTIGAVADAASTTGSMMSRIRSIAETIPGARTTSIASISISASGDNTIITPTTGKALRISSLYFTAASQVNVILKRGATSISGAMALADHAADYTHPMCFSTNEALILNLGSAVNVRGYVIWWEV